MRLCVVIELSPPFFSFYEVSIFFECSLNNTFTVGSVLLLIGSHCVCFVSLDLHIPLLRFFSHRTSEPTESGLT